jgi:predicted methyltransferase
MGKHARIRIYVLLGILSMSFVAACSTAERSQENSQNYAAALTNSERPDTERALDAARKPNEVLAFYGVKKGDKVADIWAARGYYTAILSQVVGPQGVVYSANPSSRPEFAERWKNPIYANVRIVDGPFDKIGLPQDGSLDFVIIHLNYHDVTPEV